MAVNNPDGFITSFIKQATSVGYQKSNRFIVLVNGPGLDYVLSPEPIPGLNDANKIVGSTMPLSQDLKKRLAINCTECTFPGKGIQTQEFGAINSGPKIKFPYAENFTGEITLNFNCSLDFFERKYFVGWNNKVIDPKTHEIGLYESYAKKWKVLIVMLPSNISSFADMATFESDLSNNRLIGKGANDTSVQYFGGIYFVQLNECYPSEISEGALSQTPDGEIFQISVKLNYKNWFDPLSYYADKLASQKFEFQDLSNLADVLQETKDKLSPFQQFAQIARDVIRYSDPKEFRQLIVDQGLDSLNNTFGIENVEAVAQAGQVIDVYTKTSPKNNDTFQNKLLGPLGTIL